MIVNIGKFLPLLKTPTWGCISKQIPLACHSNRSVQKRNMVHREQDNGALFSFPTIVPDYRIVDKKIRFALP